MIKDGVLAIDPKDPFFIITTSAFYEILDPTRSMRLIATNLSRANWFTRLAIRQCIKHPRLCEFIFGYPTIEEYSSEQQAFRFFLNIRDLIGTQRGEAIPIGERLRFSVIDVEHLDDQEEPPILYTGYQLGFEWVLKSVNTINGKD